MSVFTVALGEYWVPSAARDFWTCQSGKQIRAPLGVSVGYLYWMNGPTPTPHRREGGSYWGGGTKDQTSVGSARWKDAKGYSQMREQHTKGKRLKPRGYG